MNVRIQQACPNADPQIFLAWTKAFDRVQLISSCRICHQISRSTEPWSELLCVCVLCPLKAHTLLRAFFLVNLQLPFPRLVAQGIQVLRKLFPTMFLWFFSRVSAHLRKLPHNLRCIVFKHPEQQRLPYRAFWHALPTPGAIQIINHHNKQTSSS